MQGARQAGVEESLRAAETIDRAEDARAQVVHSVNSAMVLADRRPEILHKPSGESTAGEKASLLRASDANSVKRRERTSNQSAYNRNEG